MSASEFGLALLAFLTGLSFAVVTPVLPLYVEEFGVSYEALGLFFSAYSLTWGLLQLYTGYLGDRYGRRRLARIGLAVFGLSALGCAQARSFPQLLAFRILQGVGLGLLGPALLGLAAGLQRQSRAFALYRTAQVAGEVVGPVVGGYVGGSGLGRPFLLSSGLSGLAVAATFLLRGKRGPGKVEERIGFVAAVKAVVTRKGFLLLCLGAFLAEMGYVTRGIAVPLLGSAAGLTTEQIGLVMSAYSAVFILSQVPIGLLAERMRRRLLLVGCAILAAAAFGGLYLAATAWQMGVAMGTLGLTLGTIFVQSTAWAARLSPVEQRSLCLASFDALIDLSFVFTPLLVGPLIGLGTRLPFLLCAFLLLASAWTLSRTPEE